MVLLRTPEKQQGRCSLCNHVSVVREYEVSVKEMQEVLQGDNRIVLLRSCTLHCLNCGNVIKRSKK